MTSSICRCVLLCALGSIPILFPASAQAQVAVPTSPSSKPILGADDGPLVPERLPPSPSPPSRGRSSSPPVARFYFKVRPFAIPWLKGGGLLQEVGGDYNGSRGLWIGAELAPLSVDSFRQGLPIFTTRLWAGYSGDRFGVAAAVGSGYLLLGPLGGRDFLGLISFGPVFRFGSYDGTWARLRFSFSLLPLVYIPDNGDFELNIRLRDRVRLQINLGGNFLVEGVYGSVGAQILFPSTDGPGIHILTVGAGIVAYLLYPGPQATLGYERRW